MLTLSAKTRTLKGSKLASLRKQGLIPAVIYGRQSETQSLELEYLPFQKAYEEVGGSSLIGLLIDGEKPVKALIHDVQLNPISDRFQHVDFYQIKEGEKITAEIELEVVGEAPVIKESAGVLIQHLDHLEVKCLPEDLVQKIKVDVSNVRNFDDVIHIGDLQIPRGMEVAGHADEAVITVSAPKAQEEKPAEEAAKIPEVIGEKKEEGQSEKK